MHEKLKRQENKIVFSEADLKNAIWEHADEFRLNGAMYDVAKVTITANGERHFHCVQDKLESHLEERCNETGMSPAHNADSRLQQRNTYLTFDWFKAENSLSILTRFQDFSAANKKSYWSQNPAQIRSGYTTTPSVPPEHNA
ncbi:MAG: hypothetical protein ABI378_02935 [Chitinophagaceae bacterium]